MTQPRADMMRLLPLTFLVAFLLATGRWGSYLGVPSWNVYATEVGLVLTATWLLARHRRALRRLTVGPIIPILALAAWCVVRFAAGGQYDTVALRDLAPYVYAAAALAACVGATAYARTTKVLEVALLVHLAWVWVVLLLPDWAGTLPVLGGKVRLLELRADFDGACLSVLAVLAMLRASGSGSRHIRLASAAVGMMSAYTILQMGSRAGLLAMVMGAIVLGLTHRHSLRRLGGRRALMGIAGVAVALAIVLPQTYVFDRLRADPTQRSDAAAGTLDARLQAWRLVIDDSAETPSRLIIGSGFGPDFLDRSGAAFSFEGYVEKGVRAPHNFLLNTLARAGLVGVALLTWIVVSIVRATVRLAGHGSANRRHLFLVLALSIVGALGVGSLVGVILESPFGAVPFWWAAGFLLVGTHRRRNSTEGQVSDPPSTVESPPESAAHTAP